jgi:hypothetical protein
LAVGDRRRRFDLNLAARLNLATNLSRIGCGTLTQAMDLSHESLQYVAVLRMVDTTQVPDDKDALRQR